MKNQRVLLLRRPDGLPASEDFGFDETAIPEPRDGEFVVAHSHIGLQPAARIRMSALPSYAKPSALGSVPYAQTVGTVIASRHSGFCEGDGVMSDGGWQSHSLSDGTNAFRLDSRIDPPTLALGCLGLSGMTAYVGMMDLAGARPGETVFVSAATGAVGSVAGQIARILGCRVVGVAGGPDKCRHAVEEFGYDVCVDHRLPDFATALDEACPDGIDIDFENVGGPVRDAVWRRMNDFSRVILCGLISEYNEAEPAAGPPWHYALVRRITLRGFLLRDHLDRRAAFLDDALGWLADGRLRYREHVTKGLLNTPAAFREVLTGGNFGKAIVALD